MDLTPLLTSRALAAIGLACLVLSGLAALWGLVKLSYQRALGRPMPRNGLTMTLDVLAELANNIVGAVSRLLKLRTGESLFQATVPRADEVDLRATVAPPPPAIAPSPSTLRAPTLTGVAAIDEEAVFQAERKHVARALGFDASARQAIPGEAVAAARALTDEAGE